MGHHYHDETLGKGFNAGGDAHHNLTLYGEGYVREQFLKKLQQWEVFATDKSDEIKVGGIGITHATIADCPQPQPDSIDPFGEMLPLAGGRSGGGQMAGRWTGFGPGNGNKVDFSRVRRRDKGKRDSGNMTNALDELDLNDPKQEGTGPNARKRELVNRTNFVIEFAWTPDKPRPKPASPSGAVDGTAAATAGGTGGTASSAASRPASSTVAPKK
jgi:hypothetical protein